eukprot:TRINITY_DN51578_c0_g1_i1.p1 TRINITY_DN51578_c0_g1~~TRINITY_DN51578_c0_g1_i1.p1  ORF type:complete len:235 (-),score=24.68 TRINITY_DN51578_c0_g1_i1:8-712(-)
MSILYTLISVGSVVPAHATYGHQYMQHAVVKWICEYKWPLASSDRIQLLCAIVSVTMSCARGTQQYSYQHCGTQNFRSDAAFGEQCFAVAEMALGKALHYLNKAMHDPIQNVAAQEASRSVFNCSILNGDLSQTPILHAAAAFSIQVATNVSAEWVQTLPSKVGGVPVSDLSLESAARIKFTVDSAVLSLGAAAVADELDSIEAALEVDDIEADVADAVDELEDEIAVAEEDIL